VDSFGGKSWKVLIHHTQQSHLIAQSVYSVLHTFNSAGKYLDTIWEKILKDESQLAFEIAEAKLMEKLERRAPYKFSKIKIEIFEIDIDDMTFGLVNKSDEENARVEMVPEGYVLCPPWNGDFDT
jgi:hypothetical protein